MVTLLSLLFLSTAVFATVKYVFRAPELDTDKPVVTPDGTASTDVDRTDTDEPDAPGRTRREYCYNILVSGLDDDNGGSDTNILVRFDVPNKRIDLVSLPAIRCCTMNTATTSSTSPTPRAARSC